MPKKFSGVNSKAAAAKARKDEIREQETAKKEKEEEDAKWRPDEMEDRKLAKKKVIQ